MNRIFNIKENDVVSIVGAGGKTSLMYALGNSLKGKTLLTTSTKIYKPNSKVYINNVPSSIKDGTYILAKEEVNSKLIGYSEDELNDIYKEFDYTIIEADGANEMYLKGWNESEPVIHYYSNKSIGVVDIQTINKSIDNIFRLDEFKKITKISDKISIDNLIDVILDKNGLFKHSKEKVLFINKVENDKEKENANLLVDKLLDDSRFDLDRIVIGSVHENYYQKVFERVSIYVLASGSSKRMNMDKLLVDYKGKKLIEHTLDKLTSYDNKYIICKDDRLLDISNKYNFEYLINDKSDLGLSESIKLAANNVKSSHYVFFLGDMPNLREYSIERLLLEDKDGISAFKHENLISVPAKFSYKYRDDLLSLSGDSGAKKIIMKNINDTTLFEVSKEELMDIDTKEDLNKLEVI